MSERSTGSAQFCGGMRPGRGPLDIELSEALKRLKSARNRKLVARHLGWGGRPPCSLSQAGAEFQLTRERARQVYAEALPQLRECGPMPVLDAALAFVARYKYKVVSDVEQELLQQGLTRRRFSVSALLRAAEVFGRTPSFQLHEVGSVLFVGAVSPVARRVLNRAVKVVIRQGVARLSDVSQEVSNGDRELARRILQTREDLEWLDRAEEWFSLCAILRNRLVTRIQKVLALHPRISISVLHQAISADRSFRIPEPVFRSLCARLPGCRVHGQQLIATVVPRVDEVLSGAEAVICCTLADHGGIMPLSELQKLCFAAGVGRPNLWRVLRSSPVVHRFGTGIYGLLGADATAKPGVAGGA